MAETRKSHIDLGQSSPLVMPLYQSSVYTLPDLDTLDRIMTGDAPGFIYARDGHPNARALADQMAALESAAWAVVCGSGMAAISGFLLATLQQGDRIVASDQLYGKTTLLLTKELARYGVQTTLVDSSNLDQTCDALKTPAKVLLVETLSNPLLRLADLDALAEIAHSHGTFLLVDNTFATPVLVKPVEHGADVVVESLTKLIGGHSDVTLGAVCGKGDLGARVSPVISTWGLAANPFDCWLGSRGLATLSLRMHAASNNAAAIADWLTSQPGVARVIFPGRLDHPDHELAVRMLKGNFGNMLSFELVGGREAVNRFMRLANGIPFSPSLGDTTTTCSHPATTSHRYVSPEERQRLGITDGLIRLSVGIEEVEAIKAELKKAV